MLEIPGYYFDLTTKKYFKIPKNLSNLIAPKSIIPPNVPKSKRRRINESRKGKEREIEVSVATLRAMHETHPTQSENSKRKHNIDAIGMSRLQVSSIISPDCLQRDEKITVLEFDNSNPSILRIGGSSGSVASGSLTRASNKNFSYPNDELGWRTNYCFPNSITSIKTSHNRLLITSFAQAMICSSNDQVDLPSVTLSPPQTSLWSSALTRDLVALGCDKKILISRDLTRSAMEVLITGGKGGDGAVFALEMIENTILAGTRRGEVKIFDLRSTRSAGGSGSGNRGELTKSDMNIIYTSSVIHIKRIRQDILVAGMNGSIDLYDIRFPTPKPYLTLGKGNVNSYTRDAGLAIWDDQFVATAGQDKKLRLYSLFNGKEITPPPSLSSSASSPFSRLFSDPIKALAFSPADQQSENNILLTRDELERRDGANTNKGVVKLYIADGVTLECFSI